jgi:hypothetical protein
VNVWDSKILQSVLNALTKANVVKEILITSSISHMTQQTQEKAEMPSDAVVQYTVPASLRCFSHKKIYRREFDSWTKKTESDITTILISNPQLEKLELEVYVFLTSNGSGFKDFKPFGQIHFCHKVTKGIIYFTLISFKRTP